MFDAIAPFVEAGSYIVMIGEDLSTWCLYFDGEHCTEEDADLYVRIRGEVRPV